MVGQLSMEIWSASIIEKKNQKSTDPRPPGGRSEKDCDVKSFKTSRETNNQATGTAKKVSESHTPEQTEMHRGSSLNGEETSVEAIPNARQESTPCTD